MKFWHKPTKVTAIQLTGTTTIDRPDGSVHRGQAGDWIVEGLQGDVYIVPGNLFLALYRPAGKNSEDTPPERADLSVVESAVS